METIVTIDFDVIMWPSIELYNNFISGEKDKINELERDIPLLHYANADLYLYYKLTNYLLNNKNKEIIFIKSHEEILKHINTPCNLINIDHHHDLGYNEEQWKNKNINCGNWGYWGIKNGIFKRFIWLHGMMSTPWDPPEQYNIKNIPIIDNIILEMDLNKICNPSKIIICSSYNWIPMNIRPLFILWEKIFKGE